MSNIEDIVDSLENNGIRVISGFQTHSASFGTKWSNTKFKDSDEENGTPISRNTIEVNYLLGLDLPVLAKKKELLIGYLLRMCYLNCLLHY